MSIGRVTLFALLVLSALITLPAALFAAADVETVAGSGAAGIQDGPARAATFLFPFGIAIDRDGSVYISDRAAQRIRLLTTSGEIRTVAGSGPIVPPGLVVRPGYADGPALQAQFAGPEGLAIAPDGALFIADSYNFCIRKLFHDQVTTVIGKCGYAGTADGAAGVARFTHPKALAFDAAGNLYIADDGAGLRRFGIDGVLTTIRFKSYNQPSARGVAVAAQDDTVLVTTLDGVVAYHPSSGTDERFPLRPPEVPLNVPNQIVAVDGRQFVFSDPLSHNIRYLRLGQAGHAFTRAIAGGEFERGTENAGYADGGRPAARFYDPMGIALAGTRLMVADGGNRRIREMNLPSFRMPGTSPNSSVAGVSYYDVALVGGSWVFSDTVGDDSICAHIESTLNQSGRLGGRHARCHAVPVDSGREADIEDYIRKTFAQEHMDLVIVGAGWWQPGSSDPQTFRTSVQALVDVLGPQKTQLAFVWTYPPRASSFSDADWVLNGSADAAAPSVQEHEALLSLEKALRGMPILQYDSYDDLVAYELSAGAVPLYRPPADEHPNPRGNAFLGDHFAQGLLAAGLGKS